jgi:hypothetical protein
MEPLRFMCKCLLGSDGNMLRLHSMMGKEFIRTAAIHPPVTHSNPQQGNGKILRQYLSNC